jgi:uncharacterized protein YecE (DUF72 family)
VAGAPSPAPPATTGTRSRLCIGTSGWSYPEWRHGFYAGVPQRHWLAHCAARFTAIEVNATFYRRLAPEVIGRWHDETPAGFVFAVKGPRRITHMLRLKDAGAAVTDTRAMLAGLGAKLACVLWQLPASLHKNLGLLRAFARDLQGWPEPRHAFEFRSASWFDDETLAVLEENRLAVCISDSPRWPLWDAVASGLAYVRLHGHERLYVSPYGEAALRPWARRISEWLAEGIEVHVYFDNDVAGAAVADALLLIAMTAAAAEREPPALP